MSDTALRNGLIRLAHAHPEFRKDLLPLIKSAEEEKEPEAASKKSEEKPEEKKEAANKQAGMAMVRRMITMMVRVLQSKPLPDGSLLCRGQISLDFGGQQSPDAVRFEATVSSMGGKYVVQQFRPLKTVSGGGADLLVGVLRSALQEAFNLKGDQLLGSAAESLVPEPVLG